MIKFKIFSKFPDFIYYISTTKSDSINSSHLIGLNQIHSDLVTVINSPKIRNKYIGKEIPKTDGAITNQPQTFLLVKTADCIPLFLFDPHQSTVGLIHVGWRGAVKQIHLKAVNLFQASFNCKLQDILIGMGPSICKHCYLSENKPEQLNKPGWEKFISTKPVGWSVDLSGYVKHSLIGSGIKPKNIEVNNICTYEDSRFPSYYRDQPQTPSIGRIYNIIGIKDHES